MLHLILSHHAGNAEQAAIAVTGLVILAVTAWRYSRRPDYRKIHQMEQHLGYRDLTVIPQRRPRGRRRR